MMGSSPVYFHLGLPKTASTYLQKVVFPQLTGIRFYKKHDFRQYRDLKPEAGMKYLFSSEMDKGIETEMKNIHSIHPEASVIIVFRSHFSWILSKYKYSIRKWNHLGMSEYYSTEGDKVLQVPVNFYRSIVEEAEGLFPGRVMVVNFHDIRKHPGSVERKLQEFMGLPLEDIRSGKTLNKAFSDRQLIHLRAYNRRHRYSESTASSRFLQKLHYRYRQYLLHMVAYSARFIPAEESMFNAELKKEKDTIEKLYKDDWDFIVSRSA